MLRVLSVIVGWVPGVDFDTGSIRFSRTGQVLAEAAFNNGTTSILTVSAFVGGQANTVAVSNTAPATGNVTLTPITTILTTGLPDIFWPHDITVQFIATGGAVGAGVVYYELRPTT